MLEGLSGNDRVEVPRVTGRGWDNAENVIQNAPKDLEVPSGLTIGIAQNDDTKVAVRRKRDEGREARDTACVQHDLQHNVSMTER